MKFNLVLTVLSAVSINANVLNDFTEIVEDVISALHIPRSEVIPNHYMVIFKKNSNFNTIDKHFNTLNSVITKANSFSGKADANKVGHIYYHTGFNGYAGKFEKEVVDLIRQSPDVDFVEQDSIVHANKIEKGAPWGLARISHTKHLSFSTFNKYIYDERAGSNVTAYIIDTGVNYEHEDFEGRASWGITIPQGDEDEDGNGHGSHCAGTVAGKKYGVAKKAKVVAVKVLRSNGSGSMSDVVKGVEWAAKAAQKEAVEAKRSGRTHKGSVANMSLGGGFSRALNMAVNAAVDSGLHFAVAAGNDDADACDYSPASAEKAVTVGATTINDERAWFSNWGKCTDIFAPGKDIDSIWRGRKDATNTISGTSMASPHVCGGLAYLLSLEEEQVAPAELKKKLIKLSLTGVLADISSDSPNKLLYINPPSQ